MCFSRAPGPGRERGDIQMALHLSNPPQLLRASSTPSAQGKGQHFFQIHLCCPRECTLSCFCPWGYVLTKSLSVPSSSSDGHRMNRLPSPFTFPRREKSPTSLFNIIPDSLQHGSRFSPGAIKNICSPCLWHRNQILSTLYAPGLILSVA